MQFFFSGAGGGGGGLTRCNMVYVKMVNSTPLETKKKHKILSDSFSFIIKTFHECLLCDNHHNNVQDT